ATWLARIVIVWVCGLVGALSMEGYARARHLDRLRARTTAVGGRQTAASDFQLAPIDWDVPYFPRVFTLRPDALQTAWGTCRADHPGRTVLVLGDSTTRQASGGGKGDASPQGEAARTWPARLAASLPADVQLCVVAEDGYHPADHLAMLRRLSPILQPDLVLVMLCANDLVDQAQWVGVARDGWVVVYELPATAPAFRPLWNPWLWSHSEAFRFLSWKLVARFGHGFDLPVGTDAPRRAVPSLRDLGAEAPAVRLFYLPMLDDADPDDLGARQRLASEGIAHHVLSLSAPWEPLRREGGDRMHLSDHGHEIVAAQVLPVVMQALASPQGAAP
ncbi:GDSL-type esterase/lipase family protein, partial [Myxococcota bacterium]|nr:GDSL-type esterase/lipase family protein [Myxococcota bacterium]